MTGKSKGKEIESEVELMPDAWARFERAVDAVGKAPPQHRAAKKKAKKVKPKKKPGR